MPTYSPKPGEVTRNWLVIDAENVVLGQLAVEVATLLRGKHKPQFARHIDTGDFVVVINADKIALSGNKAEDTMSIRHSGYPGGLKAIPLGVLLAKNPRKVVERAVWGMMPKNKLSHKMMTKLKVYSGSEHPHEAQKPQPFQMKRSAEEVSK